jgi:mono/diheme cytochrome c family protein
MRQRHRGNAMNLVRSLVVLALVAAALALAVYRLNHLDEGHVAASAASGGSDAVERGRYLVTAGDCIACHTAMGGAAFAGGRPIDTPFGTVYSTNITPDVATGLGAWSRADFWRALHNGRSRDGRFLYPAFPYPSFTRITREDADAMYDYLRTVAPVARANAPQALRFPYNLQVSLAIWRALFFRPGVFQPDANQDAEWNRGVYLVQGLAHCNACHASRNVFGAVNHTLDLGGGLIPMQNWYAPPLISKVGAGVAAWQPGDIEALLHTGVSPRATAMGPMAEVVFRSAQFLAPADVRAIARYLHSFAPAEPTAPTPAANVDPRQVAQGAAIYQDHCAQCHGDRGEGAYPAYPALAGNPSATQGLAANAIKAVLNGGYAPVTAGNPRPYGMPPFFNTLRDAEIAAVLTYIRTSWGNAGTPVSTVDVERFR